MKYNEKYNRWVTKGGLVYRYSKGENKLVLCSLKPNYKGYPEIRASNKTIRIHRLVWETFNGEIPPDKEIDHIDCNRENNNLNNLRLVTHKENLNNSITINNRKKQHNFSFATKFKNHYNISIKDNEKLYLREYWWFRKHHKCRWES